ncbi:hypothetical protein LMG27177_07058 [Paraburkholderia fynbosensis]|uniref:Uncharacterized protein n=1 Tax=Paraburkholderia fynbosensis TaxID=1200993 RepID=A0A6J5H1R3_9BURK|nr:hypothetical protein LMG27177_07058 [Paraburkholderia fynbosensis]
MSGRSLSWMADYRGIGLSRLIRPDLVELR